MQTIVLSGIVAVLSISAAAAVSAASAAQNSPQIWSGSGAVEPVNAILAAGMAAMLGILVYAGRHRKTYSAKVHTI